MKNNPQGKAFFFGCPLDSDEREEALQEKRTVLEADGEGDPYASLMAILDREVDPALFEKKGSLDVPGWLRPIPPLSERDKLTIDRFVAFLDGNGCREYARRVGDFVAEHILPQLPCLIAVDHSLTGGAFKRVSEFYRPEAVSLVVLDSHTDAFSTSIMAEAIQYDLDTNPLTVHDRDDPYLYNRRDSYNASSFLDFLLKEGVVRPDHLYLIGINDHPPRQAFKIRDPRIERYVGRFSELKAMGVRLVTQEEVLLKPSKVKNLLLHLPTPLVYLSIDLDIGAGNAAPGVRFQERPGLSRGPIFRILDSFREALSRGTRLVGLDLTEINPRQAGASAPGFPDPTYRLAADLLKRVLWGR